MVVFFEAAVKPHLAAISLSHQYRSEIAWRRGVNPSTTVGRCLQKIIIIFQKHLNFKFSGVNLFSATLPKKGKEIKVIETIDKVRDPPTSKVTARQARFQKEIIMECVAEVKFDVMDLRELYQVDKERQELGKKRQAAVWKGEKPDKWPILGEEPLTQAQEKIPSADFYEAFYDADRMLCDQVRAACSAANGSTDSLPSIRVNTGTGTMLACVGLEQDVFHDKMPWLQQHLTKEEISKLTPDDIKIQGTFARVLEYMQRFKEVMGDELAIYCADTQGPLDLAHLMMGDDLFYVMFDDPEFTHHLMELSVELGIKTHTWMKEINGEPLDQHYHSNIYAENMGIRICEDTTAIIGPDAIEKFAMPYTQKLAQHFGGGWVHYCGRNDYLTEGVCQIPEIRAINFGFMPAGKQGHDFEEDMERFLKYGKVYNGHFPRHPEEPGKDYLDRMYKYASQGCIVPRVGPAMDGYEGFASQEEALDYWYSK